MTLNYNCGGETEIVLRAMDLRTWANERFRKGRRLWRVNGDAGNDHTYEFTHKDQNREKASLEVGKTMHNWRESGVKFLERERSSDEDTGEFTGEHKEKCYCISKKMDDLLH